MQKNQMYDERSPVPGLEPEPEPPPRMEHTLTTIPQPHAWGREVTYHNDR